jgi:hypothetical protein
MKIRAKHYREIESLSEKELFEELKNSISIVDDLYFKNNEDMRLDSVFFDPSTILDKLKCNEIYPLYEVWLAADNKEHTEILFNILNKYYSNLEIEYDNEIIPVIFDYYNESNISDLDIDNAPVEFYRVYFYNEEKRNRVINNVS